MVTITAVQSTVVGGLVKQIKPLSSIARLRARSADAILLTPLELHRMPDPVDNPTVLLLAQIDATERAVGDLERYVLLIAGTRYNAVADSRISQSREELSGCDCGHSPSCGETYVGLTSNCSSMA